MTHLSMGPGAEFDRIRRMAEVVGRAGAGWGDDAATIELESGSWLVASVDLTIDDVHFRRDWLTLEEVGWRAAMAAMSDLAAEGAEPVGLLMSVGTPEPVSDDDVAQIMKGAGAAVQALGTEIVGGDLSRSRVLVIDCCALGRAERPVRRVGAAPGDELWVTGAFGGPRAAIEAWQRGTEPADAHRRRFARPEARIAAGRWLAAHGATAMIDVSDGLAADAGHLAAASTIKAVLELDRVPVVEGVDDPLVGAASGEEYELLVALPAGFADADWAPTPLTRIGRCETGQGVETLLAGRTVPPPLGFDHVARR